MKGCHTWVLLPVLAAGSHWNHLAKRMPQKIMDVAYQGSVVSYLDPQLPGVELEREHFRPFVCANQYETFHALTVTACATEGSLLDVGLVYIGSHGKRGTRLYSTIIFYMVPLI